MRALSIGHLVAIGGLTLLAIGAPANAQSSNAHFASTEFASLKSDRVNMRAGPSLEHKVIWVFQKSGLPVEVLNRFGHWRQIRDSEGATGWVFRRLLSGQRTALVMPWRASRTGAHDQVEGLPLRAAKDPDSPAKAVLELGLLVRLASCDAVWCKVTLTKKPLAGWVPKEGLWGVHRTEVFDEND